MPRKYQRNITHHSDEARIIDKPIDEVREQVREISRFLMHVSSDANPSVDMLPGVDSHYFPGMMVLRDTVASVLELPKGGFGLRVSVTCNAGLHNDYHSRLRGLPAFNLHTDFRLRKAERGHELIVSPKSRIAAVFDGEGSVALQGDVHAKRAIEFVSPISKDFEYLMDGRDPVLLGADGQIVRGPESKSRRFRMTGDFERVELPEGEWIELQPKTLHGLPGELHKGRAVLNVDPV